jgi:quercetin 2,3-dioxygenase
VSETPVSEKPVSERPMSERPAVQSPIISVEPMGFQWKTLDPFLFCVHHDDRYPVGNLEQGPAESLAGRRIGMDFEVRDGWRMYHGRRVPGFPSHPHRGFETITIVRKGLVDHSDSLGATARYGSGDVQWMTAGAGIQHAEMFPLTRDKGPNHLELFQIWLNLPRAKKMAKPHFSMHWASKIPRRTYHDKAGRAVEVTVYAGELDGMKALAPPPSSWASQPDSGVAIWSIRLAAGASWTVPKGPIGVNRALYVFDGKQAKVADQSVAPAKMVRVRSDADVPLFGGLHGAEILLLQGRAIGEPVAQHGPFVMNTRAEIQTAYRDYQRTRFGGWPWPSDEPVHAKGAGRFAKHADGRVEKAPPA